MKNKSLLIIVFIIVSGLLIYFSRSSNLEKVAVDYGFTYDISDDGAYTGYNLDMNTDSSKYCKRGKLVSIYPNVSKSIANKVFYFCENSNAETYEFEYDVDSKKLQNVEDSSVYADELDLTNAEQEQYKKVFDTEFSEFNDKLVGKYDELNK